MASIVDRTGFIIVGFNRPEVSPKDKAFLKHPAIAGVILGGISYDNKSQIVELTEALHDVKKGFIVSVDQECRRVQRFRRDFTKLPMPIEIGQYYDEDEEAALKVAYAYGVVIGSEMREINVDLSYTPVLDIAHYDGVIGGRAFHEKPEVVVSLAKAMITGLHNSSLPACGKHFPGHGSVPGDTHTDIIRDSRPISEIEAHDLHPFSTLIKGKYLDAVMLSHIVYDAVSDTPASLSEYWLKTVLREQLGFDGLVCTDDLDMVGSSNADSTMFKKAMDAGCDLLLICRRNKSEILKLLSDFSDTEIEHYNNLAAKHLGAIDAHINNRMPTHTKHYKEAAARIENFNDKFGNG